MDNNIKVLSLEEAIWCGLTITDSAAHQILQLVARDVNMLGLQLGVKKTGCAGLSYVIDKKTQLNKDDLVFEHDGAKIFVPLKIMPFVDGTVLDYVQEGLNHVFKFNNPKAQHACGCGESFSL